MTSIYDFSMKSINGVNKNLSDFKGKVLLVVNVASQCGLTPQYQGLEKAFAKYQSQDFAVLGFPANEFEGQEPGTNSEIQDFCRANFGVTFPMFEKIIVKGKDQHPLYKYLTETEPTAQKKAGEDFEEVLKGYGIRRENQKDILWNFEKFLIGRDGKIIARFAPNVTPDDPMLIQAIESALK
ncbi:glutathione peroxidase [Bdellovibrio sp. SKB1291214]|uniref:glutathione peroxidase n=1 Tax=Bdellovibrio sp. SKB1291214 TaxID=1732569 RepID=UPI000B51DDA6|nr:glutathione peroxidase [Bdellovibrio sp. SKB1291214]UYL10764.1 glutathione peroxidase [Bdellovibrio sp. SKB1291214]